MSGMSLKHEEEILGEVSDTREDELLDNNFVLEVCKKRKRSDDDEEGNEEVVEEESDGFKTPTRPENRIPKAKEYPPAPKRREYSPEMFGIKPTTCRRRLNFLSDDEVNSFLTGLQRRTPTITIKK